MCTREEVRLEVQLGEERMYAELEKYALGQSKVISNLFGDVKDTLKTIDDKQDQSILDRNSIHALLDELKRIQCETLEQTKKTNGRVTSLETWKEVHISENTSLIKTLENVTSTLSKLNWIVITGVVTALLGVVMSHFISI